VYVKHILCTNSANIIKKSRIRTNNLITKIFIKILLNFYKINIHTIMLITKFRFIFKYLAGLRIIKFRFNFKYLTGLYYL
jgi:hypothetical protein